MYHSNNRRRRSVVRQSIESLEARQLFSTSIALVGTSGPDNFVVTFNPSTLTYSFSGSGTSPPAIAASDLNSFSVAGSGGADTLTIDGGSPTLLNDVSTDGTGLSVEVKTGSELNFFSTEHLSSLIVDAGAVARVLANGSRALVANSLTIAGSTDNWTGQVDVTNNSLIVHNGNAAMLANQAKSGLNSLAGGYWDGQGITSSAAGNDSTNLTAVGVIQNSVNGSPTGTAIYSSFASQTVANSDVLIKYAYFGDANLDGQVDGSDYTRIDAGYNTTVIGWINGDFNYDGFVNGSDYTLIDNVFNTQGASLSPISPSLPPEPTGVTIVQAITGEIDIQWNPSSDSNVTGYNVYAGTDPHFIPNSNVLLASAVASNGYSDYFDTDPALTWYYKITAVNTSGNQSIPSATVGAMMPASTSTDYTDAPNYSTPPDRSYYIDADGNQVDPNGPMAAPSSSPDVRTKLLVSFYGAGQIPFGGFGNIHLAAISSKLGGTLNSTKNANGIGVPYLDWQMDPALHDLLVALDTNGDNVITSTEIATKNISVLGYSWGAVEATNLTRLLSTANPHLQGTRSMTGTPKNPSFSFVGGFNLQAVVPLTALVTIDPVLHAVFGLSGLIKSTEGPLGNVQNFTNYYELRGGTATTQQFVDSGGRVNLGADTSFTIGNAFSALIHGDALNSHAQNTTPINVNTAFANLNLYVLYKVDGTGTPIYGRFKGSQVQHDIMPFYLQNTVITLIGNT